MIQPLIADKNDRLPIPSRLTRRSIPIDSKGSIYRNQYCPNRLVDALSPDLTTYHELFSHAAGIYASQPCLSYRKYDYLTKTSSESFTTITYAETNALRLSVGSGILAALSKADAQLVEDHLILYSTYDDKRMSPIISIFSANRYEWTITDAACHGYSLTNTALYDNLGESVSIHVLNQTNSPLVFCSGDKLERLKEWKRDGKVSIKVIVSYDPFENDMKLDMESVGISCYSFSELAAMGSIANYPLCPPLPSTTFTISFTSGTTGANPKGVILNHENAVSAITFLLGALPRVDNGKCFIFLPLTHIYERQTSSFALMAGFNLGYPKLTIYDKEIDSFQNLVEDLRLFKPHYFSIVPRVLVKFESFIKQYIDDHPNKELVLSLIDTRAKQQSSSDDVPGDSSQHPIYREIRSFVGFDNLLWTQSASAPVNEKTLAFVKAAFGIGAPQLYGLTESFGAMTKSLAYEAQPGSCGSISQTVEIKLLEHKDLNYLTTDRRGEILIRGPQVCCGYYKNETETRAAFDEEGWFHSGDIGHMTQDGKLYIIDRVKNFFKLAQGEYISPERIETVYLTNNKHLEQLFVYGHPSKHYIVAIAGISVDTAQKLLGRRHSTAAESLSHVNERSFRSKVLQDLNSRVSGQLNGLEKIRNIHFEFNPLTVERRVVTPTMKIMRPMAAKFFAPQIDAMHSEGILKSGSKL